ncbi:unnamed protein product [Allacma fusca]|uniref:Uncharacterized protein n=1 Tax=Allacma fusca TaxID=39272 RepID=A0A8J2L283_9HEXA|nr:unnamed protein product [Allacma fusca]
MMAAKTSGVNEQRNNLSISHIESSRELDDSVKLVKVRAHNDYLQRELAEENIEWKINPAATPQFGGLWKAAVKKQRLMANFSNVDVSQQFGGLDSGSLSNWWKPGGTSRGEAN